MPKKPNPPLTPDQERLLVATPDLWLSGKFPDHSIKHLIAKKRELRAAQASPPGEPAQADDGLELSEFDDLITKTTSKPTAKQKLGMMDEIAKLRAVVAAAAVSPSPTMLDMGPTPPEAESTAVAQWSDWHVEEPVNPASVNGLNEYNLEIAEQRAIWCARNTVKLIKKERVAVPINRLLLWWGGDFISNYIHPDLAETNLLGPIDAMIFAQKLLASGLDLICRELPDLLVWVVCSVGNHGRITPQRRIQDAHATSLEYMMYSNLARHFANHPNIKFALPAGYHTIVRVYDRLVRFHHGDNIKYGGGVGGITVPVNKAIAQWNRAQRVDYDAFGHFHQVFDGGNFVGNGSLIGFGAYALSIKAGFEPPRQVFWLIHSKHGKTGVFPIILEEV